MVEEIVYTNEELKSIRENLKKAFDIDHIRSGVVFFRYMDTRKKSEDHADIDSYFIERAHLGNIRIGDVSLKKKNIPLVKFEKGNDPFPVSIIDIDGKTVK